MSYLINLKIIKQYHGSFGDSLVVTGKYGKCRGKQRFTTDAIFNYLLRLKNQDNIKKDINDIKKNQQYLFE